MLKYFSLLFLLLSVTALFGAQTGFVDDFEEGDLDPRWEWHAPFISPLGEAAYELDGEHFIIEIPETPFDAWVSLDNMPRLRTTEFNTDENFAIETHVHLEDPTVIGNFSTGLWVEFQDQQTGVVDGWMYGFYNAATWPNIWTIKTERIGHRSTGSSNNFELPWGYAETDLKIERIGDTYSFYYREEGAPDWLLLHTIACPGEIVTHVGLMTKSWTGTPPPVRSAFDYFKLEDPASEPPDIEEATDDAALLGVAYCKQLNLNKGFPVPAWTISAVPGPINAPTIDANGLVNWTVDLSEEGNTFSFEATAENTGGSVSVSWDVSVVDALFDEFNGPDLADGFALHTPQTGPTLNFLDGKAVLHMEAIGDDGLNYDTWAGVDRMPKIRAGVGACSDFAVETQLTLTNPLMAGQPFQAGIWISFNDTPSSGFLWGFYTSPQNLRFEIMGRNIPASDTTIGNPTDLGLRVEKRGNTFLSFYREGQEGEWIQAWSEDIPDVIVDFVGIGCKTWGGGTAVTAEFDRLFVGIPDLTAPELTDPCPDSANIAKVGSLFTKPLAYLPGTPLPTITSVTGPGEFDPDQGLYTCTPDTAGATAVVVTASMEGTDPVSVAFTLNVQADEGPLTDFEVDVIDDMLPPWEIHDPAFIGEPYRIVGDEGDRKLSVQVENIAPYDHWVGADMAPQFRINTFDLPALLGEFMLETRITLTEYTPGQNFHTGLALGFGQYQVFYWGFFQNTGLRLERSGVQNLVSAANLSETVTLRITRQCNSYAFYYMPEGGEWTLATTVDMAGTGWGSDPAFVGVITKTWGAAPATMTAEYDYLDVIAGSRGPQLDAPCPDGVSFATVEDPFEKLLTYKPGFPGETTVTVDGPGAFDEITGLYSLLPENLGVQTITITAETEGFPPVSASFDVCVLEHEVDDEFVLDGIGELDPIWELYNPGAVDPPPFAIVDETLRLSTDDLVPYDHWLGADLAPQARINATDAPELNGDFIVETRLTLMDPIIGNLFHTGLTIGFGANQIAYWGPYMGTNIRLEFSGYNNVVQLDNFADTVILRIRRECNMLYCYFKTEEFDEWFYGGGFEVPYPDAQEVLWVGTILKTWGTPNIAVADFDYFTIIESDDCGGGDTISVFTGDTNNDDAVNLADAITLLTHLFVTKGLPCEKSADANNDGKLDLADAISILTYQFQGGKLIDPADNQLLPADIGCKPYTPEEVGALPCDTPCGE